MNKIKSQLENIISSNISTAEQREKARQLLDALILKPAPAAPLVPAAPTDRTPLGNIILTPEDRKEKSVVVSPDYAEALRKQHSTLHCKLAFLEASQTLMMGRLELHLALRAQRERGELLANLQAQFPEADFSSYIAGAVYQKSQAEIDNDARFAKLQADSKAAARKQRPSGSDRDIEVIAASIRADWVRHAS